MFYFGDWTYIIVFPAMLFALYAQYKVNSTFGHYLRVANRSGMTGAQVARSILDAHGLYDVRVEQVPVRLGDHYDPRTKVVRLSPDVYSGRSIASLGVAAHEVGHAVQDARGYVPMHIRHALVPVANFGSNLAIPLFMIGLFFAWSGAALGMTLMDIGIALFTAAVLFQIVTLPVEFNASSRALRFLSEGGLLTQGEVGHAKSVLSAAALTYVAAAAVAVMSLLRLLILRGTRDD